MKMKAIVAAMNTIWAVVKIGPEINSGLYGIWTHDLCDTGADSSLVQGFIWNLQNDQLPVGMLAQSVEHCTSITEVMGSNPVKAWMFFWGLIFTTAQVVFIGAKITFIFTNLCIVS